MGVVFGKVRVFLRNHWELIEDKEIQRFLDQKVTPSLGFEESRLADEKFWIGVMKRFYATSDLTIGKTSADFNQYIAFKDQTIAVTDEGFELINHAPEQYRINVINCDANEVIEGLDFTDIGKVWETVETDLKTHAKDFWHYFNTSFSAKKI